MTFMANIVFEAALHDTQDNLDPKELVVTLTEALKTIIKTGNFVASVQILNAEANLHPITSYFNNSGFSTDEKECIGDRGCGSFENKPGCLGVAASGNVNTSGNGDETHDTNSVSTEIPEPIPQITQEVKPAIINNVFSTFDIIDALSRVKAISLWLDETRGIMEEVPKIRNEIKDITENLLAVLQNGQNGNGNRIQ